MNIRNKKANFLYKLDEEKVEAGLVLLGAEAKVIREGHADLSNAYVRLLNNELWLVNANIPALQPPKNYNPTRSRKVLLHKMEILSLITKQKQQKLVFVPLRLYNKGRTIKLEIALGKAKVKFEKRQSIKKKDLQRELEQEFKIKTRL